MNIFILDSDPVLAAQYQCDKHVVKMILETAQILSTIQGGPYKPTHKNHPCVLWAAETQANFNWLRLHGLALCQEYTLRYGKKHKCEDIIATAYNCNPVVKRTYFVQCMPEQYKCEDPVQAYRQYYLHEKSKFAKWTKRREPFWWSKENV